MSQSHDSKTTKTRGYEKCAITSILAIAKQTKKRNGSSFPCRKTNITPLLKMKTTSTCLKLILISAVNDEGEFSNYLALPPNYSATWWSTLRFRNGSLSSKTASNYTEFAMSYVNTKVISYPSSPHSIEVSRLQTT